MWRWIKRLFRRRRNSGASSSGRAEMTDTLAMWMEKAYHSSEVSDRFTADLARIKRLYWSNLERYTMVSMNTGVPRQVIACIHNMECSMDFNKVLHNGQTLDHVNRRGTTWVPKGRGKGLNWTWEDAAIDALNMKRKMFPDTWSIAETLNFLETYNGLGYRKYHKDVNTPYLWSGTQHYSRGKYVSDGKWSSSAVSKQVGCVPILLELEYDGKEN